MQLVASARRICAGTAKPLRHPRVMNDSDHPLRVLADRTATCQTRRVRSLSVRSRFRVSAASARAGSMLRCIPPADASMSFPSPPPPPKRGARGSGALRKQCSPFSSEVVAEKAVIKCRAECRMGKRQRQKKPIPIVNETPYRAGCNRHQGRPYVRQVNQAETHSRDRQRHPQKPFRKQSEQPAQQVKLEDRLLHQSPWEITAERGQYPSIEHPIGNCGPTAALVSDNSSDQEE